MHFTLDTLAIASRELNNYIGGQPDAIAPELPTFLPNNIERIERVGVTRNASRTPYTIYWVNGRRCCIFFKRKYLFWLLQLHISIKQKQQVQVKSVEATNDFVQVYLNGEILCLQQSKFCAFLEYYHLAATTRTVATLTPVGAIVTNISGQIYWVHRLRCSCLDKSNHCIHRIVTQIHLLDGGWTNITEYLNSLQKQTPPTVLERAN